MASSTELRRKIDMHDLAERLEFVRDGDISNKGSCNYHAIDRDDQNASLSIFKSDGEDQHRYIDHANPDNRGSVIDLVMYVQGGSVSEAMSYLHDEYGFERDQIVNDEPKQERTLPEWVAEKVLSNATNKDDTDIAEFAKKCIKYLTDERQIPLNVVESFIKLKVVGFNDWVSPVEPMNSKGHCGPAISFITRCYVTGRVMGIDDRYLDAELNGGQKTKATGEKSGYPFIPAPYELEQAHTVVVVESCINALSAIAALDPKRTGKTGYSSLATRGLNFDSIDWQILRNKFVILALDNDKPLSARTPKEGKKPNPSNHRPGPEAEWRLYEILTGLNIPTMICDKRLWMGINDVNDLLVEKGLEDTKRLLLRTESWLIAGLPGKREPLDYASTSHLRLFLPDHDYSIYWQFRAKKDFTTYIKEVKNDDTGELEIKHSDLAGFRIASLTRINIASPTAALSGERDNAPTTVFAASVQTPKYPEKLTRKVFNDEQLHNIDIWSKFGTVWKRSQFGRMLSILERGTALGSRDAANFVGLIWRNGRPSVNEGQDTFFTEPEKQCPYHNLTFPSGKPHDVERIINAYSKTFSNNSALTLLVWSLGAHLKIFLGKWPHFVLQAHKNSGKSTLIKRLERTIAFTMFSGQSLKTEFRILTSISHTSHPVGWEEMSAQGQRVIDSAVALLQESFNYTVTRRGTDMTEFVLAAPVLLAGEDVPVDSLTGKVITTKLDKKGDLMPEHLPQFPIKEWLLFLSRLTRQKVASSYQECIEFMTKYCCSNNDSDGSTRMRDNYAAIMLTWRYLCEFASIPPNYNDFLKSLVSDMNSHIQETSNNREPWVWIMELLFAEMDSRSFRMPHQYEMVDTKLCLVIRISSIIHHIRTNPALKAIFDSLPVKSHRVLKSQLKQVGVIFKDGVERKISNSRYSGMACLDIEKLKQFGLNPTIPEHIV